MTQGVFELSRILIIVLITLSALIAADGAEQREEAGFGSNPGNLRMFSYVPGSVKPSAPLIVVLHGCKQKAGTFARDAGWLAFADTAGLPLLMPEQKGLPSFLYDSYVFSWTTAIWGANNQNACFNWFEPKDARRDSGEALSIRQMIAAMVQRYSIDTGRIYIVGLSAGGAMAAVMLVSYPELFAGGAIVAGVPYGCADTVSKAFQCMNPGVDLTPDVWRSRVRELTGADAPVPKVSIWHGSADPRVLPRNQQELVEQWTALHGIPLTSVRSERSGRLTRKIYPGGDDALPRVESVSIEGYGHAFPIDGTPTCGQPGDFVIAAGVCAASEIAQFWGLIKRN